MKKLICLILAIFMVLLSTVALSEVDISGLSYDELLKLVNEAQMLMMKSDKWQEVEVPAGTYQIGKEIPAGYWTITASPKQRPKITWGTKLKEDGITIDFWGSSFSTDTRITGVENWMYSEGDVNSVNWDLKEGQYISIEEGSVIFTPFKGNTFTFK